MSTPASPRTLAAITGGSHVGLGAPAQIGRQAVDRANEIGNGARGSRVRRGDGTQTLAHDRRLGPTELSRRRLDLGGQCLGYPDGESLHHTSVVRTCRRCNTGMPLSAPTPSIVDWAWSKVVCRRCPGRQSAPRSWQNSSSAVRAELHPEARVELRSAAAVAPMSAALAKQFLAPDPARAEFRSQCCGHGRSRCGPGLAASQRIHMVQSAHPLTCPRVPPARSAPGGRTMPAGVRPASRRVPSSPRRRARDGRPRT